MARRIEELDPERIADQLAINVDKVCAIVLIARRLEAKDDLEIQDEGSNASDDRFVAALEQSAEDTAPDELRAAFDSLDEEEQSALLALLWLGRGDFGRDEWPAMLNEARQDERRRSAEHLLDEPMLADYLAEGLAQFGLSCSAEVIDRL